MFNLFSRSCVPLWLPCQFLCCQVSHFLLFVCAGGCQARWNASEVILGGHAPAPPRAIHGWSSFPGSRSGAGQIPLCRCGCVSALQVLRRMEISEMGLRASTLSSGCCPACRRTEMCRAWQGGGPGVSQFLG